MIWPMVPWVRGASLRSPSGNSSRLAVKNRLCIQVGILPAWRLRLTSGNPDGQGIHGIARPDFSVTPIAVVKRAVHHLRRLLPIGVDVDRSLLDGRRFRAPFHDAGMLGGFFNRGRKDDERPFTQSAIMGHAFLAK